MQLDIVHALILLAGLVIGCAFAWVVLRSRIALAEAGGRAAGEVERATLIERAARIPELEAGWKKSQEEAEFLTQQIADHREASGMLTTQGKAWQQQIDRLDQTNAQLTRERDSLNRELTASKTLAARLTQELASERIQSQEKLAQREQDKQALSDQFKSLANDCSPGIAPTLPMRLRGLKSRRRAGHLATSRPSSVLRMSSWRRKPCGKTRSSRRHVLCGSSTPGSSGTMPTQSLTTFCVGKPRAGKKSWCLFNRESRFRRTRFPASPCSRLTRPYRERFTQCGEARRGFPVLVGVTPS